MEQQNIHNQLYLSGASSFATVTSFGPSICLQLSTASSLAKQSAKLGPLNGQERKKSCNETGLG